MSTDTPRRERERRLADQLVAAHRAVASAQDEMQRAKLALLDSISACREERISPSEIGKILGTSSSRTYTLVKEADDRQRSLVGSTP